MGQGPSLTSLALKMMFPAPDASWSRFPASLQCFWQWGKGRSPASPRMWGELPTDRLLGAAGLQSGTLTAVRYFISLNTGGSPISHFKTQNPTFMVMMSPCDLFSWVSDSRSRLPGCSFKCQSLKVKNYGSWEACKCSSGHLHGTSNFSFTYSSSTIFLLKNMWPDREQRTFGFWQAWWSYIQEHSKARRFLGCLDFCLWGLRDLFYNSSLSIFRLHCVSKGVEKAFC